MKHTITTPPLELLDPAKPLPAVLAGMRRHVYTSGTTGNPKGAMNTHRNALFATSVYGRWIDLTSADVTLGLAPPNGASTNDD